MWAWVMTQKRSPLPGRMSGANADAQVGHAPVRTRLLSLLLRPGRDVTERQREQDRLVAAQRMVEATRDELGALAEQQAALRRVATLVARGVEPSEVFSAVARESAGCLGVYHSVLWRYQPDGAATLLAACDDDPGVTKMPVGARFSLEGDSVAAMVLRTGRAARMDSFEKAPGSAAARFRDLGLRVAVGAPIVVDGRLWGAAVVGSSRPEPLPPDTEARISDFTDLVATAIANAQTHAELQASREALRGLAEQQAALRRVATLVARGVAPSEVFSAVADEMARCLHVANATVSSFDDDTVTIVAVAALTPGFKRAPFVGARHTLLEGDNIATRVFHTGRAARLDGLEFQNAPGWVAAWLRETGLRSTVAVPIIVDGRLWGTAALGSLRREPLPPDTEARMGDFADLVATAIANAATRVELIASRARIVAAGDEARRRIERDLHDGAQQRLVSVGLQLRAAEACVPPELHQLKDQISDTVRSLAGVSEEVQEISRGIHPAILSKGGLGPALKALARRSTVPVDLDVDLGADRRLLETTEVGAYYVAAEALTNAAKHARASVVIVRVDTDGANLRLSIRDDGIGGADAANGSGLVGLVDRVEALGGKMTISSQPGNGTSLHVEIPRETH
jgi:signal transduction histidine kinase